MTNQRLKGERKLQKKYNTRKSADSFYQTQMLDFLNPEMQKFISEQEMVFLSTADAKGECDASFRAGPKSFVKVLDSKMYVVNLSQNALLVYSHHFLQSAISNAFVTTFISACINCI